MCRTAVGAFLRRHVVGFFGVPPVKHEGDGSSVRCPMHVLASRVQHICPGDHVMCHVCVYGDVYVPYGIGMVLYASCNAHVCMQESACAHGHLRLHMRP